VSKKKGRKKTEPKNKCPRGGKDDCPSLKPTFIGEGCSPYVPTEDREYNLRKAQKDAADEIWI